MILVDSDIKEKVAQKQLIISGFDEQHLNGVSYDLTLDIVYDAKGEEYKAYELEPGDVVFIKTQEKLSIPLDIIGRVAEKNSRMRQGLRVDGPHYQPGHVTYAFLRVQNISEKVIELSRGMTIAQIMFEQLNKEPDLPYSKQEGASFQDEVQYVGLGNYQEEYERQTRKKVDKAKSKKMQWIYIGVLVALAIATIAMCVCVI